MGIFDLLSKEGRSRSALERHIKKVNDKFVAAAERCRAMTNLREIGTDDARYGLLRRFAFVSEGKVMMGEMSDEAEKQWVIDTMVDLGERAFAPVRRFLLEGETVSNPLRILEHIAKPDKVLEVIDEMCEREEPGYTRHPQKKVQMLGWLSEWKGASK